MDVVREVDAKLLDRETEARRPRLSNSLKILWRESMIPRCLEDLRERRCISSGKRLLPNSPKSEDE